MGVSGAGMVMLWVLLHEMHCMSCGSKDREIFCMMFLLLSVRDAKKVLLMSGSVSKLPMWGAVVNGCCVLCLSGVACLVVCGA